MATRDLGGGRTVHDGSAASAETDVELVASASVEQVIEGGSIQMIGEGVGRLKASGGGYLSGTREVPSGGLGGEWNLSDESDLRRVIPAGESLQFERIGAHAIRWEIKARELS